MHSATSQWRSGTTAPSRTLELVLQLVWLGRLLELPYSVVHDAAKAAAADDLGFAKIGSKGTRAKGSGLVQA